MGYFVISHGVVISVCQILLFTYLLAVKNVANSNSHKYESNLCILLVPNKSLNWWINDCEYIFVYSPLHGFIWNLHNEQLLVSLLAELVKHCTGITEVIGSNPIQSWIFSGLVFTTAQVVFITAKIAFIFTSLSAVQIYDFHIFTVV